MIDQKEMNNFFIKILDNAKDLPKPQYMTKGAAGMDLYANIESIISIKPNDRILVPTGIKISLPNGYEAQIRGRSGLAINYGIALAQGVGTIDSDYRGEIMVALANFSKDEFFINRGDRIAQMIINKVEIINFIEVDNLDKTQRQNGGFGSTGI